MIGFFVIVGRTPHPSHVFINIYIISTLNKSINFRN